MNNETSYLKFELHCVNCGQTPSLSTTVLHLSPEDIIEPLKRSMVLALKDHNFQCIEGVECPIFERTRNEEARKHFLDQLKTDQLMRKGLKVYLISRGIDVDKLTNYGGYFNTKEK